KPVLLIGPIESDAAKIVSKSGLGASFNGHDTNGMCVFLRKLMEDELPICKGTLEPWLWPRISNRLSTILRQAVDGGNNVDRGDGALNSSQSRGSELFQCQG